MIPAAKPIPKNVLKLGKKKRLQEANFYFES